MALFDGFFDSYYDPETGVYDREYGSDEFAEYFEQMIGSGVCIHKNPDSFKVRLENGAAVVSPGYLFIQGYWLKNDDDYTVELTGSGPLAVVAHLDLGKRMIDVVSMPVAENYPDCLVLSIVDAAAGTAQDTRYRTDICGVIDAPGALSEKIEYSINYIDKVAETRLKQIESDMAVQERKIDKKIADVEAEAIKMKPLPVGTIKFSANPNVGEKWLKCDGSFISYEEYPELVNLLRGLKGGMYDQKLLSTFVPGGYVTLGAFFEGYFWVFCKDEKKIYRISLEDGSVKGISATFPENQYIYVWNTLSIVKVGGQNCIYLIDDAWCSKDVVEDGTAGTGHTVITGSKLEMTYYYCPGFSVDQNSVTFLKKTITGETPETYPANNIPSRTFDYRPVVVYGSKPYVSLGIYAWSSNYFPNTTSYTGITTIKRCVVWANLSGNGEFILHEIDTKKQTGGISQSVIEHLYSAVKSSLVDGTPMNPEQGGLMIADNSSVYAIKGSDKRLLGNGLTYANSGGTTGFADMISPVISDNYLIFYIKRNESYVLKRYNMEIIHTALTGDWGESMSSARAVKDKLYMPDCDLYAALTNKGIIFTRNPDDPDLYAFVSTREAFGQISENLGPTRTVMLEYRETERRLYVIWQNQSYRVNIGAIKVPEGFDPFNGASLPEMSNGGIPAYIKAKEG